MRPILRSLAIVLLSYAIAALGFAIGAAYARAETVHDTYTSSQLVDGNGNPYSCSVWSSDTDAAGNHYIPCFGSILVVSSTGKLVKKITLPEPYRARRDVAVNAEGTALYFIAGDIYLDQFNPSTRPTHGSVEKLLKGSDGVWRHQTGFNMGPFLVNGDNTNGWSARNLDVDGNGRVYASANAYVYVYDKWGTKLAVFGGDDRYVDGRYVDGLEVAQGIAVSYDGSHVYIVEQRHQHVQRWDRDATTGAWRRSTWKLGTIDTPGCDDSAHFASPYDIGIDSSNRLYVLDVSCRRIQRYAASGAFDLTVRQAAADAPLYHGMSVSRAGTIIVGEQGVRYTPRTATPTNCPSGSTASSLPVLGFKSAAYTHSVSVTVSHPACRSTTHVRFSGAITSTKSWQSISGTTGYRLALTRGVGTKYVYVTEYKQSLRRSVTRRIAFTYYGIVRRPVDFWGLNAYCSSDPLSRLSNPSSWLLVDRCASLVGEVVSIARGTSTKVVLRLSQANTDRLMRNQTEPLEITAIGTSSTREPRDLVVGEKARITAAIVTNTDATTAWLVPVGEWTRVD